MNQAVDGYFVEMPGRRIGPLSEEELRSYLKSRMLRADDRISGPNLPEPVPASALAARWEIAFEPAPPPAVPATRVIVMQRDDSWPKSVRFALAAGVLSLCAYFALAREPASRDASEPTIAVPAASASASSAPTGAAPGDASAGALRVDAPSSFPGSEPARSPTTSTAPPPSSGSAPTAGNASPPAAGEVEFAGAAATAGDHWLETAQEYAGKCGCWGSLLSHSLDWTREQPGRAAAWSYLGVAQWRNWHFEEALAAHNKALQLAPNDYLVLVNAANYHFARTEAVEAAALYQRAIDADGSVATGWTGLGNARALMPDHERAIAAYRRSLELDASDVRVLHALGDEYYHTNHFPEAIAVYQRALALEPGDAALKDALARTKQR